MLLKQKSRQIVDSPLKSARTTVSRKNLTDLVAAHAEECNEDDERRLLPTLP